jgi:uncharacterized protein
VILEIPWLLALACVAMVFVGAVVQGTLGIGLGMIASPLLALADRDFIPGAILIAVIPLSLGIALRERGHIDRRGAGVALVGRVPGAVVGAAAVALTGPRFLAVLVGVSVLAAVAASLASVRFRTTDRAVFVAGMASGFTGTTTGVGGPPMALTYQHSDPAVMRSTISAFFTVGSIMSIAALALSGAMGVRQWQLAGLLVPGVVVGFLVSQHYARFLRNERARLAILSICAASALALLVEEFT